MHERRLVATSSGRLGGLLLAVRLATRELRGGLAGFRHLPRLHRARRHRHRRASASLARPDRRASPARAARILGGDVAFSLIQREADAAERAFLDGAGTVGVRRHPARHGARRGRRLGAGGDEGGRAGLSPPRHADPRSAAPDRRSPGPARAARSARSPTRRCWRGSTSSSATRIQLGDATLRDPRALVRPSPTSSPAASASARACWSARTRCAPPAWCSPAAWCAGPTACCSMTASRRRGAGAGQGRRGALPPGRLGGAHPRQRLAAAASATSSASPSSSPSSGSPR